MSASAEVIENPFMVKRGRGRPSKEDIARREAWAKKVAKKPRSDAEVLRDVRRGFTLLADLTKAATEKRDIRSLTIVGGPGIGKTFTVQRVLAGAKVRYEVVQGSMSPVNLYAAAYNHREMGEVLVVDDGDSVFKNEESLNLIKALSDSSPVRRVHYRKESGFLADEAIPKDFEYKGTLIIISNLDFQRVVDEGSSKLAPHIGAIQSRSIYIDLRIHTRHETMLYIRDVAQNGKLFEMEGVPVAIGKKIMAFTEENHANLRDLSLRTLTKACSLYRALGPDRWENALFTLCR